MRRSQDLIVWGDNCRPDEKHIGVELHGHMVFRPIQEVRVLGRLPESQNFVPGWERCQAYVKFVKHGQSICMP